MAQYFFRVDGREFGPVDQIKLKTLLREGRLDPSVAEIRRDGTAKWTPAARLRFRAEASDSIHTTVDGSASGSSAKTTVDTKTRADHQGDELVRQSEPSGTGKGKRLLESSPLWVPVKYRFLRVLASLYRIAGLLGFFTPILFVFMAGKAGITPQIVLLAFSVGFLTMAVLLVIAESIQIILDIEENQRLTLKLLQKHFEPDA